MKVRNWVRQTALTGFAVAAIFSMSVGAIAQETTPAEYTPPADIASLSGSISADGSSTVGPITEAVAEEFAAVAPGVQAQVDISGTGGGFKRFCAGETDLQDASRGIKDEEKAACAEAGVDYYEFQVAWDGITIVVNKDNTWLNCLSVDALNVLWGKDSTVTKWNQLNENFPDEPINLYGPGTDSGTYEFFTEKINGTKGESRTDYTPSEDDNILVEGVAGDKFALGFFGFAYFDANRADLRAVAVDTGSGCILPSKDTIRDKSYAPLSRPLYVYVKADSLERPEVQEFMRFYLASAMALVEEVGYVDSPTDVYVADQAKLEGAIDGSVAPDGPAS